MGGRKWGRVEGYLKGGGRTKGLEAERFPTPAPSSSFRVQSLPPPRSSRPPPRLSPLSRSNAMEQDTAAVAATVAAADATATIVVVEEQPGPSTSKEEGAATEATVATEKGEKKNEVNRKRVCGVDKSCARPLGGAQTLIFGARQVDRYLQARRGWGPRRGGWQWNSLAFAPLPLSFSQPGGRGRGAGSNTALGAGCPLSRGLGVRGILQEPLSHFRNWGSVRGGGWGRAVQSLRLPFPLAPSPPLPVGLCLGNLGPSIPHSRKRVFAGDYFLKFKFQGACVWEAEDDRRDIYCFNWRCQPFGWQ